MREIIKGLFYEDGKFSRKSFYAFIAFFLAIFFPFHFGLGEGVLFLVGEFLGLTTLILGYTVVRNHKALQKPKEEDTKDLDPPTGIQPN